jgi:hypothetical protein
MQMTDKQRSRAWIAAAIAAAIYFGPHIIHMARQAITSGPQTVHHAKPSPAHLASAAPFRADTNCADSAAAHAPPILVDLSSARRGTGAITVRRTCMLTLEPHESLEFPGHYSGYFSLDCMSVPSLLPTPHQPHIRRSTAAQK